MNKSYLISLSITSVIPIIIALILMVSTTRLPHKVLSAKAERRISQVQEWPDLIKKELLLDSYRKHLNFEYALRERDLAYAELIKTLSIALIFIASIQLILIYKLQKKVKAQSS